MQLHIAFDGAQIVAWADAERDSATFEEAAAKIQAVQQVLAAAGVPIQFTGEVERHAHDTQAHYLHHTHGH